jgi:hypothetical protein
VAESFSDEGATRWLDHFPRQNVALPATVWIGLFTGSTVATVPARATALAGNPAAVTEPANATGNYGRANVTPNSQWAAPAVSGAGVRTTAAQTSFAESSTGGYNPTSVKGFFLTNQQAQGAGSVAYGYSNFDEAVAVVVDAGGYVVRITPTWHVDL